MKLMGLSRLMQFLKEKEMGKMKELWMAAHEKLIEEYMELHPNATDEEAYDATAGGAGDRMADDMAAMADHMNDMAKEGL